MEPAWPYSPEANRVARVAILAHRSGQELANVVTVVRHRNVDTLGPWAASPDGTWRQHKVTDTLKLYVTDVPLSTFDLWLESMRAGRLSLASVEICYALKGEPRRSRACRDWTIAPSSALRSPFERHSAEIIDYWGFDPSLTEMWVEQRDLLGKEDLDAIMSALGLEIDRFIDRVGNLLVFAACDDIDCEIGTGTDNMLWFSSTARVSAKSGDYQALVWAYHGDELLLRRIVSVNIGQELGMPIDGNVDRVGFELFRTSDGRSLDYFDVYTIRDASLELDYADSPRAVSLPKKGQNKGAFTYTPVRRETVDVNLTMFDSELERLIHRAQCERRADDTVRRARRQQQHFEPGHSNDAVAQLCSFINESGGQGPIYLADPYFINDPGASLQARLQRYSDLFTAAAGRPLRVLACPKDGAVPPWWQGFPTELLHNVEVRGAYRADAHGNLVLTSKGRRPAFHDRYLITSNREILLTHSLNGWETDGVTMVALGNGVYRAQAEELWSLQLGPNPYRFIERLVP